MPNRCHVFVNSVIMPDGGYAVSGLHILLNRCPNNAFSPLFSPHKLFEP